MSLHVDRLGLGTLSINSTTGIERQRADAKELISGWLRNMPGKSHLTHKVTGSGSYFKFSRYVHRPYGTEG